MKIKFNKFFLKLLILIVIFVTTNSYANDEKIIHNIQELLNTGYEIDAVNFENGNWYINLKKKTTFQFDVSGEISNKNNIKFISCKFNEIETICYNP